VTVRYALKNYASVRYVDTVWLTLRGTVNLRTFLPKKVLR